MKIISMHHQTKNSFTVNNIYVSPNKYLIHGKSLCEKYKKYIYIKNIYIKNIYSFINLHEQNCHTFQLAKKNACLKMLNQ